MFEHKVLNTDVNIMAPWKDDWKTLDKSQNYWVRQKKSDPKEVELEYAEEVGEDADGLTFRLYRFDLERLKLVRVDESTAYLVPAGYDETWPHAPKAYEVWFADQLDDVAESCDTTPADLVRKFTSKDPLERASAYMDVASHFGLAEFDDEPTEITEAELDERWS